LSHTLISALPSFLSHTLISPLPSCFHEKQFEGIEPLKKASQCFHEKKPKSRFFVLVYKCRGTISEYSTRPASKQVLEIHYSKSNVILWEVNPLGLGNALKKNCFKIHNFREVL